MHTPTELRDLRRRAEEMAQTGQYATGAMICTVLLTTEDQDLVRELFAMPTVIDGLDRVCMKARDAQRT